MSKNQEILVTRTDLERCGFGRERVKNALARIQPSKIERRARYYDLTTAVSAALTEGETAREREARLRGDVIEEKLRRMRGEVLPREDVFLAWADKLTRLKDAIRGIDRLTHDERRKLCSQLRHEMDRSAAELDDARYPESQEPETEHEEQHENED